MSRRSFARLGLVFAFAALLAACGTPPDTLATDVRAYLARTKRWAPVEGETARTIERILRTEFVDEAEVRRQIADSRPHVRAHLADARAYAPQSNEVRRIHERYLGAWEALLGGYDAIESGFDGGDYTRLARGRDAMAEWRTTMLGVANDLRQLVQRLGIDPAGATES